MSQNNDNIKNDNKNLSYKGWFFWGNKNDNVVVPDTKNDHNCDNDNDNNANNDNTINIKNTSNNSVNMMENQTDSSNKNTKILPNTFIPYDSDSNVSLINNLSKNSESIDMNRPPNIVVPAFECLPSKSIWSSIKQMFGNNSNPQKHIYRTNPNETLFKLSNRQKRPIRIVLIGVHGFFPTKMLRTFIGEPTGTSDRFIKEAEKVVIDYFNSKNFDIQINKISLEKEGEIFERVDFFFDVMKRWSNQINESDFIYFVTHSQGCPVTIILLAKLLDSGILRLNDTNFFNDIEIGLNMMPNKKIVSILGMAGINNGPFYGRDQTLLVKAYTTIAKDAMMELFEFQKPDSIQSKKLIQSLKTLVTNNVKLTFIASINDQLVPLYSSFCIFLKHPNIFRATFIDRSSLTPDFITGIVNIAGTLLNLGYDDHNIIKEISPSLAGSLTGGGHSTIYNEYQVYLLGLKFALETTDTYENVPAKYTPYKANDLKTNPYRLPWTMRGLLHQARRNLGDESVQSLYKEYQDWRPETAVLKDIKYRLNGLKYQL